MSNVEIVHHRFLWGQSMSEYENQNLLTSHTKLTEHSQVIQDIWTRDPIDCWVSVLVSPLLLSYQLIKRIIHLIHATESPAATSFHTPQKFNLQANIFGYTSRIGPRWQTQSHKQQVISLSDGSEDDHLLDSDLWSTKHLLPTANFMTEG